MTNDTPKLVSARTGKSPLFEAQTCGRCGGSGQYSFNMMDGSRCYGCGGHGYKLTKRGAKAQEFFNELLSKKAEDLQPGDKILNPGIPGMVAGGWCVITSVEIRDYTFKSDGVERTEPRVHIHSESVRDGGMGYGLIEFLGHKHRVAADAETKAAAREQALAFQASLTKKGEPRKVQS